MMGYTHWRVIKYRIYKDDGVRLMGPCGGRPSVSLENRMEYNIWELSVSEERAWLCKEGISEQGKVEILLLMPSLLGEFQEGMNHENKRIWWVDSDVICCHRERKAQIYMHLASYLLAHEL